MSDAAVLIHAISVRSWASRVRSTASLVAAGRLPPGAGSESLMGDPSARSRGRAATSAPGPIEQLTSPAWLSLPFSSKRLLSKRPEPDSIVARPRTRGHRTLVLRSGAPTDAAEA